MTYSTVLNCSGTTIIHSALTSGRAKLHNCNCYDNSVRSGGGLVYSAGQGLGIHNCIFSGTTGVDLTMANTAGTLCEVTNCYFSGAKPPSAYLSVDSGNVADSVTASWGLVYWSTSYCPALNYTGRLQYLSQFQSLSAM
jgi:hypothetical protein